MKNEGFKHANYDILIAKMDGNVIVQVSGGIRQPHIMVSPL